MLRSVAGPDRPTRALRLPALPQVLTWFALLLLAWAAPALAQSSITNVLTGAQTYNGGPCNYAGTRAYGTATFTPSVSGQYVLDSTASGISDPYGYIYQGSFNPGDPSANLVTCNDDSSGNGGLWPRMVATLVAGQTYVVLTTTYGTGVQTGSHTYSITLLEPPGQPAAPVASVPDLAGVASLAVTAPTPGSSSIQYYEVVSSLGTSYLVAPSSPIDISGLPGGASVTFQFRAFNASGPGPYSPPSNPVVIRSQTTLASPAITATWGDAPLTVGYTSNSPAAPALSSNAPAIASTSGLVVTFADVGSTSLVLSQPAVDGFTSASISIPVTVNPADPAPTWIADFTKVFGDADFALAAPTSPSDGAFTYTSADPSVATVSGNIVTITGAGVTTLTASQAPSSDGRYTAGSVDVVMTVDRAVPTVGWVGTITRTFGDANFTLTPPTSNNPSAFSYSIDNPAVATVSGDVVSIVGAGTATLTATQPATDDYEASSITATLVVNQAAPTITWVASISKIFGDPAFTLPAPSSNSTGAFTYSSSNPAVATVSGNTVTIIGAGTATITASQAADPNYLAGSATLSLVVGKAQPSLTWIADIVKTYGEPDFTLPNPGSPSPGAFTFSSGNTAVATVSGNTVTITGAGTTVLTASQAETANYAAASVTAQLLVNARPDPRDDPGVVAGLQAQVDASVRFAAAQQMNIRDRLRQVRSGDNGNSNGVSLNLSGGFGPGLSLNAAEAGDIAALALPEGWGWWTAGAIQFGDRNPADGASEFGFQSEGLSFGLDRRIGERGLLGASFGFGWNDTDFDGSESSLSADQRALSVYGLFRGERWFVDGLVGYGELDFDIRRWSDVAGAFATATRGGDQLFGSLTLGYEQRRSDGRLVGYARVDGSHTTLDAYREYGLGIYDLSYTEQTVDNSTVSLGIEGGHQWLTSSGVMRPYWMLEYRKAVDNRSDVGINYVILPGANDYLLRMRSYADDAIVWGGGLDIDITRGWGLSLLYRGERQQGGGDTSYAVGLQLSYRGDGPAAPVQASVADEGSQPAGTTHGGKR